MYHRLLNTNTSTLSHIGGGVSGDQLEFREMSRDGGRKLEMSH